MDAGMLGSAATIEMLSQALVDYKVNKLVLDPVSRKPADQNPYITASILETEYS